LQTRREFDIIFQKIKVPFLIYKLCETLVGNRFLYDTFSQYLYLIFLFCWLWR